MELHEGEDVPSVPAEGKVSPVDLDAAAERSSCRMAVTRRLMLLQLTRTDERPCPHLLLLPQAVFPAWSTPRVRSHLRPDCPSQGFSLPLSLSLLKSHGVVMEASFLRNNDSFQSGTAFSRAAETDGAERKDKQRRGRRRGGGGGWGVEGCYVFKANIACTVWSTRGRLIEEKI